MLRPTLVLLALASLACAGSPDEDDDGTGAVHTEPADELSVEVRNVDCGDDETLVYEAETTGGAVTVDVQLYDDATDLGTWDMSERSAGNWIVEIPTSELDMGCVAAFTLYAVVTATDADGNTAQDIEE